MEPGRRGRALPSPPVGVYYSKKKHDDWSMYGMHQRRGDGTGKVVAITKFTTTCCHLAATMLTVPVLGLHLVSFPGQLSVLQAGRGPGNEPLVHARQRMNRLVMK